MISFENSHWPYYQKVNFSQKQSSFVDVTWNYHKLKFLKKGGFDDITWKFRLPLSSRGKLPTKIRPFQYIHSDIWPPPIITS